MRCYACGLSLSNDSALTNFGKWTIGYIDGERQPYCAYDAWCEGYTLGVDAGDSPSGFTGQQRDHVRASVDDWFEDHVCDRRCEGMA